MLQFCRWLILLLVLLLTTNPVVEGFVAHISPLSSVVSTFSTTTGSCNLDRTIHQRSNAGGCLSPYQTTVRVHRYRTPLHHNDGWYRHHRSFTKLYASSSGDPQGLRRGTILLTIVLAVCVWMFSIPVEFRRARLCSEEESVIYQCQTIAQWTNGIQEYYANGGGIHFDFSIDPKTLQENEQLRKSLFTK